MTNIELVDFIGGIQAILIYIFKFITAFVQARGEANKFVYEEINIEGLENENQLKLIDEKSTNKVKTIISKDPQMYLKFQI